MTLVVFSPLFQVLLDELLFDKGGCPRQNDQHLNGVGWVDEGNLVDEGIFCRRQDDPNVAVLDPSMRTLDIYHVFGEETMGVSDGHVVWFHRLRGEGWGWEAVNYVTNQQGVRHLLSSF